MAGFDSTIPADLRAIPNHPGYYAKADGTIWSTKKSQVPKKRKLWKAPPYGYWVVYVRVEGKIKSRKVHRLVLSAFTEAKPPHIKARHLDDNKNNNTLDNLAWGTPADNAADAVRNGRRPRGEQHKRSKLTDNSVLNARKRVRAGERIAHIAAELGVSDGTLQAAVVGRKWTHLPHDTIAHGRNGRTGRQVLDTETGQVYETIAAAARAHGMRTDTLHLQLTKTSPNITGLRIIVSAIQKKRDAEEKMKGGA